MSSGLRELRVWQEAVALAGDVVRVARHHQRRETAMVTDRIMDVALSIPLHIADGYGHTVPADQRASYRSARLALLRLETVLAATRHADLLPAGTLTELGSRSAAVTRLLVGYLVYLDREIATARTALPQPDDWAAGAASPSPGSVRVPS